MIKRILLFAVIVLFLFTVMGCSVSEASEQAVYTFTDILCRTVSVTKYDKVVFASASLADCWQLAGGEIYGVTRDVKDRDMSISEDVIDLGSLKEPSEEAILAAKPDLVVMMASLKNHIAMDETLERAGIPHAYFDVETFEDYLELMSIFTDITGRKDLYAKNGTDLIPQIEEAVQSVSMKDSPEILLLRTSTSRIKALNSETMVGRMLKDLGCTNIADSDAMILDDISIEAIIERDPEYIFIACMGEEDEAKAQFESMFSSNPVWDDLQAVKNDRCYYLQKELFHHKPNVRWSESYEILAELLA